MWLLPLKTQPTSTWSTVGIQPWCTAPHAHYSSTAAPVRSIKGKSWAASSTQGQEAVPWLQGAGCCSRVECPVCSPELLSALCTELHSCHLVPVLGLGSSTAEKCWLCCFYISCDCKAAGDKRAIAEPPGVTGLLRLLHASSSSGDQCDACKHKQEAFSMEFWICRISGLSQSQHRELRASKTITLGQTITASKKRNVYSPLIKTITKRTLYFPESPFNEQYFELNPQMMANKNSVPTTAFFLEL